MHATGDSESFHPECSWKNLFRLKSKDKFPPIIDELYRKCEITTSIRTLFKNFYESLAIKRMQRLKLQYFKSGVIGSDNSQSLLHISALTGGAEDKT